MNKILLLAFLLLFSDVCCGQKKDEVHQVSLAGGYLSVYRGDDINLNGFSLAAFYHYTPLRWVGLQTGVQYNYTRNFLEDESRATAPVQLPLYLVLFPKFRYSITGGIYYELMNGHVDRDRFFAMKTRNGVWGYEIGLRRNFRPLNIKLEYKKALKPWLFYEMSSNNDWTSWSVNVTVEVPIWRNHSKR